MSKPFKPKHGQWFRVTPTFIWRCCKCGHAARMTVGTFMKGRPIKIETRKLNKA